MAAWQRPKPLKGSRKPTKKEGTVARQRPYYFDYKKSDPEMIVRHLRDINVLLTQHGVSGKARAAELKITEQALRQYSAAPGTQSHRLITPDALDKLRSMAIRTHWAATDRSMSDWALAEGPFGSKMVPQNWEVMNARGVASRHMFLPRAVEVAEVDGGNVADWDYSEIDESSSFANRSRFRRLRHQLERRGVDVTKLAVENGIDRYYTDRIGIEYQPWRVPPPKGLVEKMAAMMAA